MDKAYASTVSMAN